MKPQNRAAPQRKQKSLEKFLIGIAHSWKNLLVSINLFPALNLADKFDKPAVQTYWFEPG